MLLVLLKEVAPPRGVALPREVVVPGEDELLEEVVRALLLCNSVSEL